MELIFPILMLVVALLVIAGVWKAFSKAGRPGIACIIPIWNMIVMMQIAGRPVWWFLLLFIPIVGIVIGIIVSLDVAKSFGKGAGFGVGLALLGVIFWPILGFGTAQYQGVQA